MIKRWRRKPQEDRLINGEPLAEASSDMICGIVVELLRELARRSGVSLTREVEVLLAAAEAYDNHMDERIGL